MINKNIPQATFIKTQEDVVNALNALAEIDPNLAPYIARAGEVPLRLITPGFEGMVQIIISQLISREAAHAIWQRFQSHFLPINPDVILETGTENLRQIGLTNAKSSAILNLAQHLHSNPDFLNSCPLMDTNNAIASLIQLKGIGPWTAEVYLMFCAGHADIFPGGDVALRVAAGHIFWGGERPDEKTLRTFATRWQPHRSVAARLLWLIYAQIKNKDFQPI